MIRSVVGGPLGRLGLVEAARLDGGVDALLGGSHHRVDRRLRLDAVGLGDLGQGLAVAEPSISTLISMPIASAASSSRSTHEVAERSSVMAGSGPALAAARFERLLDRIDLGLRERAVSTSPLNASSTQLAPSLSSWAMPQSAGRAACAPITAALPTSRPRRRLGRSPVVVSRGSVMSKA